MQFLFENHILDRNRRELRRGPDLVALEPQVFDSQSLLRTEETRCIQRVPSHDKMQRFFGPRAAAEVAAVLTIR